MVQVVREWKARGSPKGADVYRNKFIRVMFRTSRDSRLGKISLQMFNEQCKQKTCGMVQVDINTFMLPLSRYFSKIGYELILQKREVPERGL